ncbi:ribonuclease E inhibitor RraB [Paeniglutamicibacter sp. R2-26]|uniref:ribonuclease E inhibitor RraB n=1 Tax=Paeniglutamicibacter sp. R2-26 TaxID=3144417 RepID=UPI003EE4F471
MSLELELERMRRSLSERAANGDLLDAKREVEHFVSYAAEQHAEEACAHFESAGWSVDRSESQDANGLFPVRVYRRQALDAEHAERSIRAVYAINEQHRGYYDGFGAVAVLAEGSEPPGFFRRLFGRHPADG